MTIGKEYIKKELMWYGLLVTGIIALEYFVLVTLSLTFITQVVIQVPIGVILMTATFRTGYRIWIINQFYSPDPEDIKPESS